MRRPVCSHDAVQVVAGITIVCTPSRGGQYVFAALPQTLPHTHLLSNTHAQAHTHTWGLLKQRSTSFLALHPPVVTLNSPPHLLHSARALTRCLSFLSPSPALCLSFLSFLSPPSRELKRGHAVACKKTATFWHSCLRKCRKACHRARYAFRSMLLVIRAAEVSSRLMVLFQKCVLRSWLGAFFC